MSDVEPKRQTDIPPLEHLLLVEFDKHERMQALFEVAALFESERYWKQLGEVWVGSESIFQDLEIMEALWDGCGIHDPAQRHLVMDEEDRKILDSLPDEFEVWRGGFEGNIKGWSWTLDYDRALFFADRYIPDNLPLVAATTVLKKDVLAYFGGRNEQEIVIHPSNLGEMRITQLPPQKPDAGRYFFFMAQTGRLELKQEKVARGFLFAKSDVPWETFARDFENRLRALNYYGLERRAQEVRELMEVYKSSYRAEGKLVE